MSNKGVSKNLFDVIHAGRKSLWLIACSVLMMCIAPACNNIKKNKKLNERITLRRQDKNPYGTYAAYENLKFMFPEAVIAINKQSPAHYGSFAAYHNYYSSDEEKRSNDRKTLYVIITPIFSPGTKELESIMEFVGNGNHVLISSFYWGDEFNDTMHIDHYRVPFDFGKDSLWMNVKNPVVEDSMDFTYPGRADDNYFTKYDTTYAGVLGHNKKGQVNFIRHTYTGGGSIYMHSNPLAFSNFFLLHKKNNEFYDNVFSYFPQDLGTVQWDEYFRYYGGQREGFSSFQVIMKNAGLRSAFWLVLLLFALLYLFESKRKQRIIPRIAALRNTSLDFVKTIGRLYYQNRDNKNLATKMTAHLMDHIRSRYNIPTSVVDDKFISNLAYKSGYDLAALRNMFYHAKMIQDYPQISDGYLMEFNKLTEDFYKHQ